MHSPRDTRARAPGKLMLAGEYAILHGGEAWVMAVDRHAVARDRVEGDTSFVPPEARAAWEEATREGLLRAMPDEGAFTIDLSAMNHDGRKLGVGSSAAGCVAALAWAIGREGRASSVPRAEAHGTVRSSPRQGGLLSGANDAVPDPSGGARWSSEKPALGAGLSVRCRGLQPAARPAAAPHASAPASPPAIDALRESIARVARRGHRRAQGGGSGVDVIASALGGVVRVGLPDGVDGDAVARRVAWPSGVKLAVLWSGTPVKTWEMLSRVDALKGSERAGFDALMAQVAGAAARFGAALEAGDSADLIAAVREHHDAMAALGERAGAPIVTEALARLAAEARPMGAAVKPSGAGGGDVSIAVAEDEDALDAVCSLAAGMGFARLTMDVDADGVVLE